MSLVRRLWVVALPALLTCGCGDDASTAPPTAPADGTSTTEVGAPRTTALASTTTMAGLALAPPSGMPLCRPEQLEAATGMGLSFLRFFNRGATCGLAGHPGIEGRATDGTWRPIDTVPSPRPATTGPPWSGAFTRELVAVVSIRHIPTCDSGVPPTRYDAVRVVLPSGAGSVELPLGFDVGGCPLEVTPFSADSQDP